MQPKNGDSVRCGRSRNTWGDDDDDDGDKGFEIEYDTKSSQQI